jgi:hypothetical protein
LLKEWLGKWILQQEDLGISWDALKQYTWTKEHLWKAFSRTLCADVIGSDDSIKRLDKNFDWNEGDVCVFLVNMKAVLSNRVFVATSLRHFCLARGDAQPGDIVFATLGAETPYLLRPKGKKEALDSYYFIGECYVHGLMDGNE